MSLGVGPGALESPAGPRGRGRGQGHTWQQLQALILGRQPVPLALPAPFGAEYVLGGGLGVLAHAEGLTGGLRGKVVRAEELGGPHVGGGAEPVGSPVAASHSWGYGSRGAWEREAPSEAHRRL